MSSYAIRDIRPGDEEQLGRAHVAVWKATYAGMMNSAKLDAVQPQDRIERWERIIAGLDEASSRGVRARCAIDIASSRIAGFATSGPPRDDNPPAATELWSFNVLPQHHGTGVATELLDDVIGRRDGSVYLWVAAGNDRAITFYRKHRFELDGTTVFDAEWECLDARMVRA
ncbi:GCN5-related N-acetyltransferase [Rhodococcus sp. AW25M09]|uniref:GNAT family N-acetyltransferase n=1 Tax=Rhodococcus sp. AW25M09 TaxID=1268303 RepID=UPI0002ABB7F8|nr:GNAT family N-acetyltransferase [Rhodococcus sp. AW25M09]CCQ15270.1 GCN5-related N-acetyltransferase [Rhodococcus sp. AW25M09]